jgi:hypothetical protein
MYIEIDFNLLYQIEKIAQQRGISVAEIVNQAVAEFIERQTPNPAEPKPDEVS